MRTEARVLGMTGGALILGAGTVALTTGSGDVAVVGGWVTVVAAIVGIVGGALTMTRPGLAGGLMIVGVVLAALVAPGVIPAIAESATLFFGYLIGSALLITGAILAVVVHNRAAGGEIRFSQ